MEDDPFKRIEPSPEDSVENKIRKVVTFDIEVSSESNKKIAFEFFATMYKKHFWALFIASIIAVVVLFIAFVSYGTITFFGLVTDPRIALNAGLLAMPVAMLMVMPLLERNVYARDSWTLSRQGMQPFSSLHSKKSYIMALVPVVFLLIGFIDPAWGLKSAFVNPFYVFFVIGGIPVAIFEELVFRGVYWKYILIRYAKPTSMTAVYVINALAFASIHLPTLFILYSGSILGGTIAAALPSLGAFVAIYFLSGLLLGLLKEAFNNVLAPIAYHVTFNVIFMLLNMNSSWIILFQAILLLAFILGKHMGWFKGAEAPRNAEPVPEFKKNILETRLHSVFRLAFLAGNGLVLFYYGSEMSRGDPLFFLTSAIVIVAAYACLGYLYVKRMWFFKLPSR